MCNLPQTLSVQDVTVILKAIKSGSGGQERTEESTHWLLNLNEIICFPITLEYSCVQLLWAVKITTHLKIQAET